jgi:hypothetical protein
VYLADNSGTDFSNGGYIKRSIYDITDTTTSVDFIIDTTDVPAGSYYLLGAVADSTDPDQDNHWYWFRWFGGSNGPTAPPAANITDLNNRIYDFELESNN